MYMYMYIPGLNFIHDYHVTHTTSSSVYVCDMYSIAMTSCGILEWLCDIINLFATRKFEPSTIMKAKLELSVHFRPVDSYSQFDH